MGLVANDLRGRFVRTYDAESYSVTGEKKNYLFRNGHLIRVKSVDGSLPAVLAINAQRRQQFHDLLFHGRACRLQRCNRWNIEALMHAMISRDYGIGQFT